MTDHDRMRLIGRFGGAPTFGGPRCVQRGPPGNFYMSVFITFKRWSLKNGQTESELVKVVREKFQPHYAKLPGCLGLGLLHIEGTRSYLTQQFWESREHWRETTGSDHYQAWWQEYIPLLERWDEIMEFEDEWEAEDLLGTSEAR